MIVTGSEIQKYKEKVCMTNWEKLWLKTSPET